MSSYIVTNFAYGTGPYIRITELAFAVNDYLGKEGHKPLQIILPHIYGHKQRRILIEEFGDRVKSEEVIFDSDLGSLFRQTFYENESYEKYLGRWVNDHCQWETEINSYLNSTYGEEIAFEISRSPRISLSISPAYFTSFGSLSEILDRSRRNPDIDIANKVLRTASDAFSQIESQYDRKFISEPGTFQAKKETTSYAAFERVPPFSSPPKKIPEPDHGAGIYVTVTGIPGLDRLYLDVAVNDYHIYTNDESTIFDATEAPPWIVGHEEIKWHVARSGWGSVWLSIFTETPLLIPEWKSGDDPEIYYNNRRLEDLGIAQIYTGQSLEELHQFRSDCIDNMRKLKQDIRQAHGTLDGVDLVAKDILRHFLKSKGNLQ